MIDAAVWIVTCVVMQRNGAGFYAGSSVYWDNARDGKYLFVYAVSHDSNTVLQHAIGSAAYRYENKSLYALVNVFALSV